MNVISYHVKCQGDVTIKWISAEDGGQQNSSHKDITEQGIW